MAQLLQNKIVSFLVKLITVIVILGIAMTIFALLKPGTLGFIDDLLGLGNGTAQGPIQDGVVSVEGSLPFYEEFLKSFKQCKLSIQSQCYCKINYPGTPNGYVLELATYDTTTNIRVHGGAEIVYSKLYTGDTFIGPMSEEIQQITMKEDQVENNVMYFRNTRFLYPSITNGLLDINEFKKMDRQFISGARAYSAKGVKGENFIQVEDEFILYKFDDEKSVLYPSERAKGLKLCKQVVGIADANDEFNNLVSTLNVCGRTGQRQNCNYVQKIPENFTIVLESKKLILKHGNKTVKESKPIKQNTCKLTSFSNTKLSDSTPLTTLTFNDHYGVAFYPFENDICFLPYDESMAQSAALQSARQSAGSLPTIAACSEFAPGLVPMPEDDKIECSDPVCCMHPETLTKLQQTKQFITGPELALVIFDSARKPSSQRDAFLDYLAGGYEAGGPHGLPNKAQLIQDVPDVSGPKSEKVAHARAWLQQHNQQALATIDDLSLYTGGSHYNGRALDLRFKRMPASQGSASQSDIVALRNFMCSAGWANYGGEWWHYEFSTNKYERAKQANQCYWGTDRYAAATVTPNYAIA